MKTNDKNKQAENQKLIPKLRFPEFQDAGEWQEKSLGELAKIITGNTPKTADPNNYGGERLFVSPADISDHRYISSTKTNLSDQGFENAREIPPKSVLFVCIGSTIGKVAQNICECATNQQINSVIPFKEYSNDFIYSLLEKNSGEIAALAGKQAVPIINKTLFSSVTLSCPSLPEQQKIADCLSSLDELIAAQAHNLDTLKTHKKGLMQQLFPAPGQTIPTLRFPEFQEAGDWEERPLESICGMQAGKFVSASKINEKFEASLYPCYGGNGLRGFTKTHTHTGKYPLIGRQGALCGNIFFAKEKFHATEHAIVGTPFKGINITWLYYLLVHLNLNQYATGQAQPGLSVDILKKVTTIIPAKEKEQKKIADCLSSLDELIAPQALKLDTLKAHKKGLMQQLFPNPDEANG